MSMQIKIKNADFSGLGLPKFKRLKAGFQSDNLAALYLFEDGANGDILTIATDSSGNGRHASLVTGSVAPVKAVAGAHKAGSDGSFLYSIPGVAFGAQFSGVVVAKTNLTPGTANQYPGLWKPSSDVTGGSLANTQNTGEAVNIGAIGSDNSPGTGNVAWYHPSGYMKPSGALVGNARYPLNYAGATQDDWMAFAFSYSPTTDTYVLANSSTFAVIVNAVASEVTKAKSGTHTFGMGRWSGVTNMPGEFGLFGLWSAAFEGAVLQELVAQAKQRMLLRGISAY